MKGTDAPGIDGFTVNWLRKFWDSLKLMTFNTSYEYYKDGSLSSQNRHHSPAKEKEERPDIHWKLQTNLIPFNPLQA